MIGMGIGEIILGGFLALGGSSLVHSQPLLWMAASLMRSSAPAGVMWLVASEPAVVSGPAAVIAPPPPVAPPAKRGTP